MIPIIPIIPIPGGTPPVIWIMPGIFTSMRAFQILGKVVRATPIEDSAGASLLRLRRKKRSIPFGGGGFHIRCKPYFRMLFARAL